MKRFSSCIGNIPNYLPFWLYCISSLQVYRILWKFDGTNPVTLQERNSIVRCWLRKRSSFRRSDQNKLVSFLFLPFVTYNIQFVVLCSSAHIFLHHTCSTLPIFWNRFVWRIWPIHIILYIYKKKRRRKKF